MFACNLTLHSIYFKNITGHRFYLKVNVPEFIFFFYHIGSPVLTFHLLKSVVIIYITIKILI